MLTAKLLARLQATEGEVALREATSALEADPDYLRAVQHVGRFADERLAREAVAQVQLRRRAQAKFSDASRMFFTRDGLEQATPEAVARHRAGRFAQRPVVFDLCAGIGGDALALAERGRVIAVDRDRLRLHVLGANGSRLGRRDSLRLVAGDVLRLPSRSLPEAVAFCDPSRRTGARRLRGVHTYEPPLHAVLEWLPRLAGMAVKVSPAVRLDEIGHLPCEIEFVSLGGELKEATLWFGDLRLGTRRATLLPAGVSLEGGEPPVLPIGPVGAFLIEPDPAVMRSGLVTTLGASLGAHLIAEDIGFLSADDGRPTPFGRTFRVLETAPFRLKSLQAIVDQRRIGRLTVKRRGSAVEPEVVARRLRLRGEGEGLVILTRHGGRQTMILAERVG